MECMHAIEPRGIAGQMCLFWKDAKEVFLIKYGDFFIEMVIDNVVLKCKWRIVVVYVSTDERKRFQQLAVLFERIASYTEPCLLMGDFNNLLSDFEKEWGNYCTTASMRGFQNFVTTSGLLDLGFEGYPYT
ncbi:hypothetical protein ACFX1T_038284 [Malus domestica]